MRWSILVVLALVAACLERPDPCFDGRFCPANSRCDGIANRCIVEPQHCAEFDDGAWCSPSGVRLCIGGACQQTGCGDGYRDERTEQCDDGPLNDDLQPDSCRHDCRDPSCGDGVLDTDEKTTCLAQVAPRPGIRPDLTSSPAPALRLADLDGDGALDLIAGVHRWVDQNVSATIQTCRGDPAGGFYGCAPLIHVPVATSASGAPAFAVADIDGDERSDDTVAAVVARDGAGALWVHTGDVLDGPLALAGSAFLAVELGDLDQDGRLDAVVLGRVAGGAGERLTLVRGIPGGFAPWTHVDGVAATDLELVDLDADGHLDVVTADERGGPLVIRWGTAAGPGAETTVRAEPCVDLAVGPVMSTRTDLICARTDAVDVLSFPTGRQARSVSCPLAPSSVAVADIDGDRRNEVIAFHRAGIAIYSPSPGVECGLDRFDADLAGDPPPVALAGDVSGDRRTDLIAWSVQDGRGGLRIIEGGGASVAPPRPLWQDQAVTIEQAAMADVVGDAAGDMVAIVQRDGTRRLELVPGSPIAGAMDAPRALDVEGTPPLAVATGDLDGDDRADVVALAGDDHRRVVTTGLGSPSRRDVTLRTQATQLRLADLDRDGALDVVAIDRRAATIEVLLNRGDHFASAPETIVPAVASPPLNDAAFGDIDGDGAVDCLLVDARKELRLMTWTGAGCTPTRYSYPSVERVIVGGAHEASAVAGATVVTTGGWVKVITLQTRTINTDDGDTREVTALQHVFSRSTAGQWPAIGDVNHDGVPDLIVIGSAVHVHLGRRAPGGASPFTEAQPIATGVTVGTGGLVADVDGDGVLDVLAVDARGVWWLRGQRHARE